MVLFDSQRAAWRVEVSWRKLFDLDAGAASVRTPVQPQFYA